MRFLNVFILLLLLGCATTTQKVEVIPASKIYPPEKKALGVYHKVSKGETLYKIARAYNVEVKNIIKANRIKNPALIKEGELLYIPAAKSRVNLQKKKSAFIWPLKGKILSLFGSNTTKGKNKGIDIRSESDYYVKAARDGVVCYTGELIKGYRKIVIINHGNNLYTLYAYNVQLLVKKGDSVKQGDKIALLDKNNPVLHFEVRKGHKALNPLKFLH